MLADDDRDIDPDQPLSLDDALLLGTRLHRLGHLNEARELYSAVLANAPEHPLALQFLGIIEHQQGNQGAALDCLSRALALAPELPAIHHNLGNVLLELARFDQAAACYQRCAELGGQSAELWCNIGVLARQRGELAEAERAYQQALALDPDHLDAHHGYGRLLAHQGRHKEALRQFAEADAQNPSYAGSRQRLALALCILGRLDEAAQIYREWADASPDDPTPRHYLAACTGERVPERASDAYVSSTFDDFAQSFDAKLEALHYRVPELVAQAVARCVGEPRAALDVLDAGCGTGLCAPLLAPYARNLVGVDLSVGMLERAKARGGYRALYRGELTAFMQAHAERFDLIVAADTLCYFGALESVCAAAFAALRPGGRLVFTVEALAPAAQAAAFSLRPSGRYGHARDYVMRALAGQGFTAVELADEVLRTEAAEVVPGYLVVATRVRP
ncbi:MAG TPA: tetratricopeptide repeat protein [Polyangiales bacterium]